MNQMSNDSMSQRRQKVTGLQKIGHVQNQDWADKSN